MALTTIITGGAHQSESKSTYGSPGDQLQSGSGPDYSGEVSMRSKTESQFKSSFGAFTVYRPKNPNDAAAMARIMMTACNNPNIGYSQTSGSQASGRLAIFTYGPDSKTPINCDCSSLVSYCITNGMGVQVNGTSSELGNLMKNTGKFFSPFPVSEISFSSNPPYNGDVLQKNGHVEMVVGGNPREGKEDEITVGSWTGNGTEVQEYRNQFGTTYDFKPRTTAPTSNDQYFNQSYGITQNGSYAWGRFSEIMKSKCDLPRGACRKWYTYTENGYPGGVAPSLGAVMCYTNKFDKTDPGIAYIVEGIEKEAIMVSYRDIKTNRFKYERKVKRYGSWDMDLDGDGKYEYVFQGFIYNPAVDMGAQATSSQASFVTNAKQQIGNNGSYTKKYTGVQTKNAAWSGAFVAAVASQTGSLLNIIIPNTFSCSDIGRIGVIRSMGTWFDGPAIGGQPHPQLGDIALFRTSDQFERSSKYSADKAGIVIDVSDSIAETLGTNKTRASSFKVAMGDVKKEVVLKEYTTDSPTFSGLFRPFWAKVDGTTQSIEMYRQFEGIYTQSTSIEDIAIRDLRYIDITRNGIEPSIKSKDLLICAINYTGMLANLYGSLSEVGSSAATDSNLVVDLWQNTSNSVFQTELENDMAATASTGVIDLSNVEMDSTIKTGGSVEASGVYYGQVRKATITLTNTVKAIYSLLNEQIKNPAGTLGVMANMFQESKFDITAVNASDGGSGLIQWTDTKWSNRAAQMKSYCLRHGNKKPWNQNLPGQIEFLFYESTTNATFKTGLSKIKVVAKTNQGMKDAVRLFLDYYEIGGPQRRGEEIEVQNFSLRSGWGQGLWELFFGNSKRRG